MGRRARCWDRGTERAWLSEEGGCSVVVLLHETRTSISSISIVIVLVVVVVLVLLVAIIVASR